MTQALALIACYIVGAVPFGLIIGKITRGVDIRDFGSGNIGASNVLRTLGLGPGICVMVLDTAKGLGAVVLCEQLGLSHWWIVSGALLSVLGHSFSVFLKFRGGKGVATSLGVIIGLNWAIAAVAFTGWVALVAITRYISVASIVAALSVPIQMILWKSQKVPVQYQLLAGVAALAIVLKHTSNIKRLASGTEARFGQRVDVSKNEDAGEDKDGSA